MSERLRVEHSASDLSHVEGFTGRIASNVGEVILGKSAEIELLLAALLARGHVLVEDVPGTGKTMLARAVAVSTGLSFKRMQCTPDLLPSDVTGVSVYDQSSGEFEFRAGPVFVNILLADEINRATPRTQSALLEAMQERQVTADGITRALPDPFLVLATQNPVEFEGTFPLPEAQLDRFLLRLRLGYPERGEEGEIIRRVRSRHPIDDLGQVVEGARITELADAVADVHVDRSIEEYILDLVRGTREHDDVMLGASPRGAIALASAARALAGVRGRDYVVPDDVKRLASPVLAHRLVLDVGAELRGSRAEDVIADLLDTFPVRLDERA